MAIIDERYSQREMASVVAARRMQRLLERRLRRERAAAIVVSGGSTPARCFSELSTLALDWERVTIVPSDERWVPGGHADSNDRLLRTALAVGCAAEATVEPLYRAADRPEPVLAELDATLAALPLPFAVTLLGMGADGHIASLFPDAADPEAGLGDGERRVVAVDTAASPHPRVSLTLPFLSDSAEIVLLAFGQRKRAVIDAARAGDTGLPVGRLLARPGPDLRIVWAP